jgi:hypothetical protein
MFNRHKVAPDTSHDAVVATNKWLLSSSMQLNISLFAFNLLVPAYPLVRPLHAVDCSPQPHCLHKEHLKACLPSSIAAAVALWMRCLSSKHSGAPAAATNSERWLLVGAAPLTSACAVHLLAGWRPHIG